MKHTNVAPKRTLLIAFMAVVLAVGLTLPVSLASAVPSSSSKPVSYTHLTLPTT